MVTETYPPEVNGVAMTTGRMVAGLLARGHSIELVRPKQHRDDRPRASADGAYRELLVAGVALPRYRELRLGLPARRALRRAWSGRRPDVVQVVTEGPLGSSAVGAARALGLPVVSDFHTNFHSYSGHYGLGFLRRPIAAWLRRLHNRTDCTLVPTGELRRELEAGGYRGVRVVARGVDTTLYSPAHRCAELRRAWGAGPETLVVLSVGRLAPEKNLELVVRAAQAIGTNDPRTRLVFVGDGPARAALQASCPRAVFAGMRTGTELARHYASADLFLFPSTTETYGNVTTEAMASGLAVVAYDYAAAREHLRHGHCGLLAAPGDAAGFTRLAVELAADRPRLRAYGVHARAAALGLRWDAVTRDLERVLHEVARRPRPAGEGLDATTRTA